MRRKTNTRLTVMAVVAIGALLLALTASALARDRNNDRIPDRWERSHGLSLKKKQGKRDQDRDRLRNRGEFRADMLPRDEDTDDDGIEDGQENAGQVVSFTAGVLTIDLFNGPDISGLVTDETEIECEDEGDEDEEGPNEDNDEEEDENGIDDDEGESEDDDEEFNDDDSDATDSTDGDEEVACTAADLVPGAVVHEAELELTGPGAVFEEIELVK